MLILVGCAALIVHSCVELWRLRADPYDLARLWDNAPAPEEADRDSDDIELIYCHTCGDAFPTAFDVCPQCGNRFRG